MMELVRYDAACRALAEARSVDEVKDPTWIVQKGQWIKGPFDTSTQAWRWAAEHNITGILAYVRRKRAAR
jgi:hypothetical protein